MTIQQKYLSSYQLVDKPVKKDELGRVGHLLSGAGKLTDAQVEQVLRYQQEFGVKFGEACLALELISIADLDRALAQQFSYPVLTPGEGGITDSLYMAFNTFNPDKEKIKGLRIELQLGWFNSGNKLLLFAGADGSPQRSRLLANLAIAFTQAGKRTLMLDANLRDGELHTLFNISNDRGVADILAGRASFNSLVKKVNALEHLYLLTRGSDAPNPQELLSLPSLPRLLEAVDSPFDIVLVNGADLVETYDSQLLAAQIPGAVCVVRERRSRMMALRQMKARLESANCRLLGCVYQQAG